MGKSNMELSQQRIEDSRKRLAKCLNLLETTKNELRWACEAEHWNDEVAFQVEDAAKELGFALATLTRWNDDDVSNEPS